MQVIRVISGDHELSALDFQKHYRLGVVHLMDTDRSFERQYSRRGWPFLMVVNAQGQVVYTCNNLIDNDPALKRELQKIKMTTQKPETVEANGVAYMASTLARNPLTADSRNERFTAIAAGRNGQVAVVFTAETGKTGTVVLRLMDGTTQTDISLGQERSDDYDASVAFDKNSIPWVCWTSSRQGRYNIFLTNLSDIRDKKPPIQVTTADDDAMHGRLACDASGAVWITYYRWQKMGGRSRDKEVFLRRYADGTLSPEIQISPTDVPDYEDHTDPAIACCAGGAAVCWSWDYHKPQGYPQDCESPTIFVRPVGDDLRPGAVIPLSGKQIESVPVLSEPVGGVNWCAWDALDGTKKSLCVRAFSPQGPVGSAVTISDSLKHLCSPTFAFDSNGNGCVIWAETADGTTWRLMRADYDSAVKRWGPKSVLAAEKNPRYPSTVYDAKGTLWTAYSVETPNGREVMVKDFETKLVDLSNTD